MLAGRAPYRFLTVPGIILLAFALRLNCLDCQSFWLDEVDSALWTTLSTLDLFLETAQHLHTPGYYLLLRIWAALTGLDEFTLRYFSVAGGLLLVPILYHLAVRLWHDQRTAHIVALLTALSPAHIYYSQETRMYAMTPILYTMMLFVALKPGLLKQRRSWVALAAVEITALYFHVFAALQLLALNTLLLLLYWRRRDGQFLYRWLLSQTVVALAFAPWLVIWVRGGVIQPNVTNVAVADVGRTLDSFLHLAWRFLLTGMIESRTWSGYLVAGTVAFAALALFFALFAHRRRWPLSGLLLAFAIPLLVAYAAWWFNPLTHPRYLLFLLAPLLLVAARVMALLLRQRLLLLLGLGGLALFLSGDVLALDALANDNSLARYDSRRLAQELAARSRAGEIVLLPPNDNTLWYYDPQPATATNWPLAAGHHEERALRLRELLQDNSAAFLVQYEDLFDYDPHEQLPFLLELNGRLTDRFTVDRMDVDRYALNGNWTVPTLRPQTASCGPLTLTGAFFEPATEPAQAAVVALRWRLERPVSDNLVISARLWDGQQRLAGHDALLLSERSMPASTWPAGQHGVTYHVLPVPLGTPPLAYDLTALVYDEAGQALSCDKSSNQGAPLGAVQVEPSTTQTADPYGSWQDTTWQTPLDAEVAPGLLLEGYTVRPADLTPGTDAFITMRWRAGTDLHQTYTPELLLHSDDETVTRAQGSLFERYPTDRWSEGELLIETRQVTIPPTLSPMQLVLNTADAESELGALQIDRDDLTWELPPQATPVCAVLDDIAELAGYRWTPNDDDSSSAGALTLYWRAEPGATSAPSYTVFTHLLAPDGRLVGQHDGHPANGQRPTPTWLPGEIIADEHELTMEGEAQGPLRLTAGLYDVESGERVAAYDCDGNRLPDNAIVLTELPG